MRREGQGERKDDGDPMADVEDPDEDDSGWVAEQQLRLKKLFAPIQSIIKTLEEIQPLTSDNVPCVSNSLGKDKVQLQESYTDGGMATLNKSLTRHIAVRDAKVQALKDLMKELRKESNTLCEVAYRAHHYKRELIATKATRLEDVVASLDQLKKTRQIKLVHNPRFKERDERKQANKRKYREFEEEDVFDRLP